MNDPEDRPGVGRALLEMLDAFPATRFYGCTHLAPVACMGGILLCAADARLRAIGFGVVVCSLLGALVLLVLTGLASFAT